MEVENTALLTLQGCGLQCDVYLDSAPVASSLSAYSPITVEIPSGRHRIRVVAERFFRPHGLHQPKYDWLQVAGLWRPVELQVLPRVGAALGPVAILPRSLRTVDVRAELLHAGPCGSDVGDSCEIAFFFDADTEACATGPAKECYPPRAPDARLPAARLS